MHIKGITTFFLIILLLSVVLLPVLAGAGPIDLPEKDDLSDADDFAVVSHFPVTEISLRVYPISVLLKLQTFVFALFVVYWGGRFKHKRFNDLTIAAVNALGSISDSLKTALFRAVFSFRFLTISMSFIQIHF
jgi:hypothetical protein